MGFKHVQTSWFGGGLCGPRRRVDDSLVRLWDGDLVCGPSAVLSGPRQPCGAHGWEASGSPGTPGRRVQAGPGGLPPRSQADGGGGRGSCPGPGASLRSLDVGVQDRACAWPAGWDPSPCFLAVLPAAAATPGRCFLSVHDVFILNSRKNWKQLHRALAADRQRHRGPPALRETLRQDRGTSHHTRGT